MSEQDGAGHGQVVPIGPARLQLVADTEALDARHGGRAVLRGGLGAAEVPPVPGAVAPACAI